MSRYPELELFGKSDYGKIKIAMKKIASIHNTVNCNWKDYIDQGFPNLLSHRQLSVNVLLSDPNHMSHQFFRLTSDKQNRKFGNDLSKMRTFPTRDKSYD